MNSADRAPRVLVLGTVLGQPMGGVRRHNQELLPRAARLLAERGGSLTILEGLEPVAFPLPGVERITGDAPPRPLLLRWMCEGGSVRRALALGSTRRETEGGSARREMAGEGTGYEMEGESARRTLAGGFDLVHTGHLPAPRRLRVPYTITIHDLRWLDAKHAPPARRIVAPALVRDAARRAALVIAVSETVRQALFDVARLDPSRVRVVPNAADHFEPLPREAREDAPLLHVGHLEPRKNIDVLLHALALDPGLPPLLLAGAAKEGEPERLQSLAARLGVLPRVKFLGAFDDRELPVLFARAACVVLPSRIEGFGIPALEAQRARVPLAVARAGALPEVSGHTAPTFAPEDAGECARAIRSALAAPREHLDRAAERASRFRWEDSARILVETWIEAT